MLLPIFTATLALSGLVSGSPVPAPAPLDKRLPSHVVSSGSPVVIDAAGVYIRVNPLNGNLIAGYAATDGSSHVLRTALSTDGGSSWDALGEVYRANAVNYDIDNAYPIQLPSGRVLYAYRNHDRPGGTYTYYRITISYSDDGGVNWKYLSTVDQRAAAGVNGLWEPFLRVANDGSLQCYYSAENSATDQDGLMRTSTDGGVTWSNANTISGSGVTSRDGMIGVASIDDSTGKLIAVFENTESGVYSIDYVLSSNDGHSWGSRGRLYTAANNKDATAPQVINVGGTLVTSFMTNEDVAGTGGSADGAQMKVVTSTDGGASWGSKTVTGAASSHWPGLYARDRTNLLALYSKDGLGAVSQLYALAN
ncbi:glycoside hydrolase family 93 protein [Xylariaceae sp. FL0016]|nr:glycoside hydrolase family 93 protein [Xylariaceae sp. FL0016]